jgi:hypothetical protein
MKRRRRWRQEREELVERRCRAEGSASIELKRWNVSLFFGIRGPQGSAVQFTPHLLIQCLLSARPMLGFGDTARAKDPCPQEDCTLVGRRPTKKHKQMDKVICDDFGYKCHEEDTIREGRYWSEASIRDGSPKTSSSEVGWRSMRNWFGEALWLADPGGM